MSRNGGNPDLRLRPLRVPDDYPGLTAANQAARSAAGRPSSITVADLTRYLEHLVNCDPQRDLVVAELDGRICGYGIVFWRDLVEGGRIVVGHGILAPDARTADTTATLFGWLDERLSVVGAGLTDPRPDYASAFTWVDNALASAFLADRGWSVVARAYEMLRHSLDDIPKRPLPDGLEIRPVGHADAPRVWDALVDGFRDHRHKPESTDEDRERFLDNPVHDPSCGSSPSTATRSRAAWSTSSTRRRMHRPATGAGTSKRSSRDPRGVAAGWHGRWSPSRWSACGIAG